MDFLKSAVASAISKGPPFPYTFGDQIDVDNSIWKLYNGTKREDGSNCSIFSFDINANKSRLPLAKNALRKLRTLRHPGIIKVLEAVETDTYIYIATERLVPLSWHVRRQALSVETTKWGLFTVASTLRFVNDEGASVHGNIRISSIFTSESGEWKLGGLDILSSMKEEDAVIYTYAGLVPDVNRNVAPEISKTGWDTIKRNPLPAVDSYSFGILIYEVFNGGNHGSDQPGQTRNIPPSMQQSYKRLLNANPKARLSVSHFLEQGRRSGGFFETPLIRLSEGVESLGLKNDAERAELLSELDELSEDFPEEFFKMKILPELLKSMEFGGGGPKVFGLIIKIGEKLSDDDFETRLNPVILRLFASPDRQIRVCLLDNLPKLIDHFSQKVVTDKIFPQIVTGFTDMAPIVREQTVKSVLTLVTKLSDRVINGELLKYLAKTANDEQPGIRTNTTICLGKIARNMGGSTRQKVLIAAFTRSLRDPFVHARNAALQALAATADLFPDDDCATKLLPAICPSLVDKEKIVRDQANKTIDIFIARIRKYAISLPDTVLPPPSTAPSTANGTSGTSTPRMGTPQADAAGWAGWAISSFTSKLGAASGEIEARPTKNVVSSKNPRASSVPPSADTSLPVRTSTSSASNLHRQALNAASTSTPLVITADDEDVDDGWGAFDDTNDDANAEADSFFDAPSQAESSVTSPTVTSPNPFDDAGEPDFAGWLAAQSKSKVKAPLAKGLSKTTTTAAKAAVVRTSNTSAVKKAAAPTMSSAAVAVKSTTMTKTAEKKELEKAKVIDTKPKDDVGDDWGDAWD